MKYLGVIISSDGRMEKEVEARIGSATRVIGGMNETVLKRKELSRIESGECDNDPHTIVWL